MFISLFAGILRKLKKKESIVAFLNKFPGFFFCTQVSEYFLCETLENPWFCALYPGKPWNFYDKNPRKFRKIPWKTLELELKIWLATLFRENNNGGSTRACECCKCFSYYKLNLIHGAPLGQDFTKNYQCFRSEHVALSAATDIPRIQESTQNRNSGVRWKAKGNSRFKQVK